MPKLDIINQSGTKVGTIDLVDSIFGIEPNQQVMFDAVVMQQASARQGTHSTKNRGEVSGGGRKPYRQKGTGRARQGSTRAVQWRGGGIIFGPKPRDYGYRLNRKVRRLAIKSVLSQKINEKAIKVVDKFEVAEPKTKDFIRIMGDLKLSGKTLFIVAYSEDFEKVWLSMRNIPNALMIAADNLNVYDVMNADEVIFTEAAAKETMEVFA